MTKKIVKILCLSLCFIVLGLSIFALIYLTNFKQSNTFVKLDTSRLTQVFSPIKILDNKGQLIEETCSINGKKQISISSLQDYTINAFICTEDKRFYKHNGIDFVRIGGALLKNISSKCIKEGASTITQQLIKNTHLDTNKTINRKVNELLLATTLESHYSKEQILEMYLNTIYFGRNSYGIENAANVYFDKSATELTLSESAVLAGLIKAPSLYAPDIDIEKCTSRRDLVLKLMLDQKAISFDEYTAAIQEVVNYTPYANSHIEGYTKIAINQACKLLNITEGQLFSSNLVIETYCDQKVQKLIKDVISNDTTTDKNNNLADIGCVISSPNGKIVACCFRGSKAKQQSQVGSCFKPIIAYAPAFDLGLINQSSLILDEMTNFNGYTPNSPSGFHGWVTVKQALSSSLNVPAVKLLNVVTLKKANSYLSKLGISKQNDLSASLGNIQGGLDIFQLTKCYNTLSNEGKASDISLIKAIYQDDRCIYQDNTQQVKVFSQQSAFLTTNLLIDAAKTGTAKRLFTNEYQIAAKTGTVGDKNGNSQALVVAYTTEHTLAVKYCGDFDNTINGGTAPALLAKNIFNNIYSAPPKDFPVPEGITAFRLSTKELYRNHNLVLDTNGEKFYFDNRYIPTTLKVQQQTQLQIESNNQTEEQDDNNYPNDWFWRNWYFQQKTPSL